ncbi:MAG: hypothetical protein M5U28_12560 [Sandaracinaceae bacterium]|nr:hypothetical protein [Sandaracinaceae bacterium]
MTRLHTFLLLAAMGLASSCGPSENDYSAYITANGPQCGNNKCEPGDLCVDPEHNNFQGLCRRTPR